MPQSPEIQLARFREAVDLLGGNRPAARFLGIGERHLRRLHSGASPLHEGLLRCVAQALLAHADRCRTLERQLSPAFAGNLTPRQLGSADRRGRRPHMDL